MAYSIPLSLALFVYISRCMFTLPKAAREKSIFFAGSAASEECEARPASSESATGAAGGDCANVTSPTAVSFCCHNSCFRCCSCLFAHNHTNLRAVVFGGAGISALLADLTHHLQHRSIVVALRLRSYNNALMP